MFSPKEYYFLIKLIAKNCEIILAFGIHVEKRASIRRTNHVYHLTSKTRLIYDVNMTSVLRLCF